MSRIISDVYKSFIFIWGKKNIREEASPLMVKALSGEFLVSFKFVFNKIIVPAQ